MTAAKNPKSKPKQPRERQDGKRDADTLNQATTADFEQEGMGIAPKE
jgi:hypothetical protein